MKKKNRITNFLLVVVLLAGLGLLLYPTIANYWNSRHQSKAISSYASTVENLSEQEMDNTWANAVDYNSHILERDNIFVLNDEENELYRSNLDVSGTGVMGYVEIPAIEVVLPIYHSTSEAVLQVAVGHLEWTSLPVGGSGTHCVLSGHRGLPSAKLFTHLDQLVEGDIFFIRVLDEVLTYEVDKVSIVLPQIVSDLMIEDGQDYCTLVTCTPYGINSHRLLVRGHRIENAQTAAQVHVTSEAVQVNEMLIAIAFVVPLLIFFLLFARIIRPRDNDYY